MANENAGCDASSKQQAQAGDCALMDEAQEIGGAIESLGTALESLGWDLSSELVLKLRAENAALKQGYDAARLEVDSLKLKLKSAELALSAAAEIVRARIQELDKESTSIAEKEQRGHQ